MSFSVVAEGTELMYRWRRDGADLSDGSTYMGTNTSALIVLNAGTEQIGEYTCAVSNDVGSDTSDAATLTFRKWTAAVHKPFSRCVTVGLHLLNIRVWISSNICRDVSEIKTIVTVHVV